MAEEVLNEMQPETQPEVQPEMQPENTSSKGAKVKAAVKEWFRKRIVTLKVKPQLIPLVVMTITTIFFMLALFKFSAASVRTAEVKAINGGRLTSATGICMFISTLLSLLYLVSFLNAFPKRKKPNIFFIVLVFVMIAAMIACDIVYYVQMDSYIVQETDRTLPMYIYATDAQPYAIAHIVLLGVSAVVFALLPVYSKLIRKIDTSKRLESATEHMNGGIDIEED